MKKYQLLLAIAPLALSSPAWADDASSTADAAAAGDTAPAASQPAKAKAFTTGVARGRDLLNTAISASTLDAGEVQKLGARSLSEIFRDIPGVRAEAAGGEGFGSVTIRGLPQASTGAKFVQLQEDGLPVLEFGDVAFFGSDTFLRADLSLDQVQSIRGGSASTFGSNSPGGVINLISRTGAEEGGAIQTTTGVDYEEFRTDFTYGSRINDTTHFNIGGFYRAGEGPRKTGYTGYRGGQIKLNVTKEFDGGFIRFYGKILDDHTPVYGQTPFLISGSDSHPRFANITNYDFNQDTLLSRYIPNNLTMDETNTLASHKYSEGIRAKVKSFGVSAKFELGEWALTDNFRYSDISGSFLTNHPIAVAPASALASAFAGPGAILSYASGPNAGQVITDPASLNGNGLLAANIALDIRLNSMDYVVNDMRASRVWEVGGGKLTTTFGFYKSHQVIDQDFLWTSSFLDVVGNGTASRIDVSTARGYMLTQGGYFGYATSFAGGNGYWHRKYDMGYDVNAPYGSVNFSIGKLALGASVRYDYGKASGQLFGADLGGGRIGETSYDVNGDGVILPGTAETRVAILPLTDPQTVNYKYHYFSYSVSANYRVAEPFSVFARYSRGARAGADRILFSSYINSAGGLADKSAGYDPVRQAEIGAKYRNGNLELNLTGFWAKTEEHNILNIQRKYRAVGLEFEGSFSAGPWSLAAGATYTEAKILDDTFDASTIGHIPQHQPKLVFQLTPQYSTGLFTVGAAVIGQTSSYASNANMLKMPAYTTVNAFLQVRPVERVQLALNANNLFNAVGFTEMDTDTVPLSGIELGRPINGRTISASLRFDF